MKLSELKVGMKVRHPDMVYEHEVLKVGDGWVVTTWRSDSDPVCVDVFRKPGDWKIIEPRKKPSERLLELFRGRFFVCETTAQYVDRLALAICTYLDEQASEQK